MYVLAQLVYFNYRPETILPGMWFLNYDTGGVWELSKPPINVIASEFIDKNGYPIELRLVDTENRPIASPEQMGWICDESHPKGYRKLTVKDVNQIIEDTDGLVEVSVIDFMPASGGPVLPELIEGKVLIRPITEEEEDE